MRRSAKAATLATTILLTLSVAGPAFADDPTAPAVPTQTSADAIAESATPVAPAKLADIKAKGAAAIAKRMTSLSQTGAKVAAQTTDCTFNAARATEITTTAAGLTALGGQLAAATDPAMAKTLYTQIFTNWRVYLVVLPKAGKAMRCDLYLTRIAAFTADAAQVQAKIDAAKAGGADTTAAQGLKDAAVAAVAALNPTAAITPCMALAPDNGDAGVKAANAAALKGCDTALDAVGAGLRSAHAQLEAARKSLAGARKADRVADRTANKATRSSKLAARKAAK